MYKNQHITPKKEATSFPFKEGAFWEDSEFEIISNMEVSGGDDLKKPCKHCHSPHKIIFTRHDFTEWHNIEWICPFVIIAYNEGGYNSTGVCLNCVIENTKDINIEVSIIEGEEVRVIHEINCGLLKKEGWVIEGDWPYRKNGYELNYKADDGWRLNGEIVRSMEEIKSKTI